MYANKATRKIGVFSQGGLKNLGDEALFAAVVQNVRLRVPEAEIVGFTVKPEDTRQRHGILTFPVSRIDAPTKSSSSAPAAAVGPVAEVAAKPSGFKNFLKAIPGVAASVRFLRKALHVSREIALEPRFLWESYRRLKGVELLLVAGSHPLNDIYGPWAFPLTLFKWTALSRLTRTKFVLLSVGGGPLSSPTSRFLIRRVLHWCSYRSYRDAITKELVESLGVKGGNPVYPDLVFSLQIPVPRNVSPKGKEAVVGINPVPFYDVRYWAKSIPARYNDYVEKFAQFTNWLDENGFSTLFFPTQLRADVLTIKDIQTKLKSNGRSPNLLECGPIEGINELVNEIVRADVVVANRYHGILISLLLNRPVVGIAYHEKTRALLEQVGQGNYVLDAANFTTQELIEKIRALCVNAAESKREIASRIAPLREALERQYDDVFSLIGIRPLPRKRDSEVLVS